MGVPTWRDLPVGAPATPSAGLQLHLPDVARRRGGATASRRRFFSAAGLLVYGGGPAIAPGADFVQGGGPCGNVVGGTVIAATMHQGMIAPQGIQLQGLGPPQGLPLQIGTAMPTIEDYDGLPM